MESVLCGSSTVCARSCAGHLCGNRPTRCTVVTSSTLRTASAEPSSSTSFTRSGFADVVLGGLQLRRRVSRKHNQAWRAVADISGQGAVPRKSRKVKEPKVVVMVDPVEAKRLAALEMEAIQARGKLKRQRVIEAINGGWAVLGLTAGLVIEGYTGKSILSQFAGYLDSLADFITQITRLA